MGENWLAINNGEPVDLGQVPLLELGEFSAALADALDGGGRASALFGEAAGDGLTHRYAVIAHDARGELRIARTSVTGDSFASLAAAYPQLQLFEREIAEQFGLRPLGHPWLKPVRYPWGSASGGTTGGPPVPRGAIWPDLPPVGTGEMYRVEGDEIHEVAVGPVHAGIIEPGHFRFQCQGEIVLHLEIALGYQHRGVEARMAGAPHARAMQYMQTLAGDTTIGHASAYCQAVEALSGVRVPPRAQALRGVALELERIANHVGDLGALAGDVGFLPTANFCGRLRGDYLNMTAALCGSRFGRGMVRPGGVGFDVDEALAGQMLETLAVATRELTAAVNLLWETPSVMARFEETGEVSAETCRRIGLVGVAARACGIEQDIRHDMPYGIYRFSHIPVATWHTGDVFARAHVRWLEVQQSIAFVREQLEHLPGGAIVAEATALSPNRIAVSLVEGWRGEICHVAITGDAGRIRRYKVVDPSFHNWLGLAIALRGQQISDFPLCNKSFNLSYCGHDL